MMKRRGDAESSEQMKIDSANLKSRKAVISYIIALAMVLILCIVLSHFMHIRDNDKLDLLNKENTTALQKLQSMQELNDTLTAENDALYKDKVALQDELTALESQMQELESKLQSADTANAELQKQYDELKKTYDALVLSNTEEATTDKTENQ